MEITSTQAYSILGIVGGDEGAIISKCGMFTVAFELKCPEAYSLYVDGLEQRHDGLFLAFKNLPDKTFLHKQDIFLRRQYTSVPFSDSFIEKAENKHFQGREYLEHKCILAISITDIEDLEKAYIQNPISYKEKMSKKSRDKLITFLSAVENSVGILKNVLATDRGGAKGLNEYIRPLSALELRNYIRDYTNCFAKDTGLRDIHFAQELSVGEYKAAYLAICDENYLPDNVSSNVVDDTLPISNSNLYMAELEGLGVHLQCNHVYNQIIWFEGNEKLKTELDGRIRLYGQHRGYGADIELKHNDLVEMQKQIVSPEEKVLLCRSHFSLMIWDEDEEFFNQSFKKAKEVLGRKDFKYYIPSYEGLKNIYIGNVIGRENKLDKNYYYLTELNVALCLFINYTTFKDDEDGIFFNDRLFQIPLRRDIWDTNKKRIPARNGIVFANTGGGKSFFSLNIAQQFIDREYTTIVCEFGKSFEQLCHLYPEKSLHIDYDGTTPLGINPFDLEGEPLDDEKLETLIGIVKKFWRMKDLTTDTNQSVSLSKLIVSYYKNVQEYHSFPGFYTYVKDHFEEICKEEDIDSSYFEIGSFIHVCSEFMPGGRYENVCKVGDTASKLSDKTFIVFELTKIKSNPFLSSLVMTILFDVIKHKILSDRRKRGILIFDEYAETAQMKDSQAMDENIHSVVSFCYQKFRKENGAVMTIVQSPVQLPRNEFTDSIIANTQLLYVLPTTEVIYDAIIECFKIKNQSHVNQMKSIRNDFTSKRPHSECWIRWGENYAAAVRLEPSKEKYYAFQTEGDDWAAIHESYSKTHNMAQSISEYIQLKK